ncbi:hypothetical protein [Prevotella intermedia]|nr:hypothetical protein [Prevotella intermedia]
MYLQYESNLQLILLDSKNNIVPSIEFYSSPSILLQQWLYTKSAEPLL